MTVESASSHTEEPKKGEWFRCSNGKDETAMAVRIMKAIILVYNGDFLRNSN
ncbi:MAG: hypothetical protein WA941_03335 [Nitrososphaeraceae archaeon]